MVGTVYLLMTGGNYFALQKKRSANAALLEGQTQDSPASVFPAEPQQEQTTSQV